MEKIELTDEQLDENYNIFIELLKTNINRDGLGSLIQWLDKQNIKTTPASSRYHGNYKGGLIVHNLNVYNRLLKLVESEFGENSEKYSFETLAITALLHDISKVNYYEIDYKNVKDKETGQWHKEPYFAVKNENTRFIYGTHSENSVFMLEGFLKLTYEEKLAILNHMGSMDSTDSYASVRALEAYRKSPLALLLFQADLSATCIDEK